MHKVRKILRLYRNRFVEVRERSEQASKKKNWLISHRWANKPRCCSIFNHSDHHIVWTKCENYFDSIASSRLNSTLNLNYNGIIKLQLKFSNEHAGAKEVVARQSERETCASRNNAGRLWLSTVRRAHSHKCKNGNERVHTPKRAPIEWKIIIKFSLRVSYNFLSRPQYRRSGFLAQIKSRNSHFPSTVWKIEFAWSGWRTRNNFRFFPLFSFSFWSKWPPEISAEREHALQNVDSH